MTSIENSEQAVREVLETTMGMSVLGGGEAGVSQKEFSEAVVKCNTRPLCVAMQVEAGSLGVGMWSA